MACFPSQGGESFGVVLLEAMAARTAILASDIPAYRSVSGCHAVLVPPGDTNELASALEILLAGAEGGDGMSSPEKLDAGQAHAATFSMAGVASRYMSIYEEAIESARRQ